MIQQVENLTNMTLIKLNYMKPTQMLLLLLQSMPAHHHCQ